MTRILVLLSAVLLVVGAGDGKRSGFDDAGAGLRAMQDDDAANPGFLWVRHGEALWSDIPPGTDKSCARCHGGAADSMRGVAARYPALDSATGRVMTLEARIRRCQANHQQVAPSRWESDALLALTSFVALQSRGQAVAVDGEGAARPFRDSGQRIFETRIGQLNLACVQCHDRLAGQRLAGSVIPQGHPNGYPTYRLEWQGMGSLHRRIRNCMTGVRAEPFEPDSAAFNDLALFLGWRANGLRVETPAVRP